jgi:hypothetical protein
VPVPLSGLPRRPAVAPAPGRTEATLLNVAARRLSRSRCAVQ